MGDTDNETECNITNNDWDFDAEEFEQVSKPAKVTRGNFHLHAYISTKDFIGKLLVTSQRERLGSDECIEHPWISEACK